MYERILVATDGSDLSEKAVTSAIDLAKLAGSELIAVTVAARHQTSHVEGALLYSVDEVDRMQEKTDRHAQQLVDAVCSTASAKGVGQTRAVVMKSNHVAESIIEAARTHNCELIVMASHGRRGLRRLLMGSETLHVLTHSHTPVLVLR
jgi:nucleotide-binding universal stress UspA family protein